MSLRKTNVMQKVLAITSTLVVLVMAVLVKGNADARDVGPESAVKRAAIAVLQNYWGMLAEGDADVSRLYDLHSQEAVENAETVRAKLRQHYLIPAEKAGFRYQSVKVDPVVEDVEIKGNLASVRLHATVTYETVYDPSNEPVTTVEANIPYELKMVQRNGDWLVLKLESFDTYTKHGERDGTTAPNVW